MSPRLRTGPSWWRTTDPLVLLVGAVSLVTYALHGYHGALTRDLALYTYAGQQVADGVPPYLGVLNRAGPLAHVFPGIGILLARAGGFDQVVTTRMLYTVIASAATCALYLLARDVFASRRAGLVSAAALVSFHGFVHYATNGPREKTPMVLFIVIALWAMTHRRWFTAGLFVSLATLCLQTAFPSTFAAVLVGALLLAAGGRVRALVRIALGGAVPVAVLAVWFALAGSLRQSVDAFYGINSRYTVPNPILEDVSGNWLDARTAYGASLYVLIGGLLALLVVAGTLVVLARRRRRAEPPTLVLAALAVGALAGLFWITKDYDSWADLFPVLPLAAIGVGAAYAQAARRIPARAGLAVAVVLSVVGVAMGAQYAVSTRTTTLDKQRAFVDAVLDRLPRDVTITSVEAPQPLVFTSRTNPTRYQMFRGGLQDYMDQNWPGGLADFQRTLVAEKPDLISMGATAYDDWRAAIEPQYVYLGGTAEFGWYARTSLGPRKIAELRKAAGGAPGDDPARDPDPSQ